MEALILMDIQCGLTRKKSLYNAKLFLDTVNSAIKAFRLSGSKIIFVQHNNTLLKKNTNDWEIDPILDKQEYDIVIQKIHGNAFHDSDLKAILSKFGINDITISGLVSHGCVKATCMAALAEGLKTSLLKNGHTTWNKDAKIKIDQTEKELIEKGVQMVYF
ncbi:MAG: isochorismatase family protein [Bacteroidales bacterium]|nr:isochorismatase family protein [Bacteroidales bacterium]